MEESFAAVQDAARAGRVTVLKHGRARATERGFTVEAMRQLLVDTDAQAWPVAPRVWIIADRQPATDSGRRLHVRVRLTARGSLLVITGWIGDAQRTARRWAGKEVRPNHEILIQSRRQPGCWNHPGRPFAPRPSRRRSMHSKSNATITAGQPPLDLVLERLPSGELAWLRPTATEIAEEPRYVLTDAGRRTLYTSLATDRGATIAEVHGTRRGR